MTTALSTPPEAPKAAAPPPRPAIRSDKEVYDQRYAGDYRSTLSGYEVARFEALRRFIPGVATPRTGAPGPLAVLDYGCGSGLHIPLWEELYPGATFSFADISSKALEKLGVKHPRHAGACSIIEDDRVELADASFDVVVSVEVMEHVADLGAYLAEVHRLLKPGGVFIWTTPCANRLSIEHVYNVLTGQIDPTPDGSRRWRWEDPTHVRRLRSAEAAAACHGVGFGDVAFRYRAHAFSFLCTKLLMKKRPALAERLMLLDYAWFRRLPNAASMIGAAWKPRCATGTSACQCGCG
jgi:SAM-dependent methyltransferase